MPGFVRTSNAQTNPLIAIGLATRHKILQALQEGIEDDLEATQTIQGIILGARGETDEALSHITLVRP